MQVLNRRCFSLSGSGFLAALFGLTVGCFTTPRFWNGTFRANLPFIFSEIEGMIGEGFPNNNGGY
jgi:hypothetical protein